MAFPVFLFVAPTGEIFRRFEGAPEDSEILELVEEGLSGWSGDLRDPEADGQTPQNND